MLSLSLRARIALLVALPTAGLLIYWLLKSDEDDDFEKSNVTTSKQTIIEVKVPKDLVGAVIGRGGANIRDISDKTGARVDFASRGQDRDHEGEFRVAKIRGSQACAQEAEMMVHRIIAESVKHTVRVTVRVRCLGRIIGRNGDSIRRIQRVSCAKINIDANGDESSPNNEKGISISGSMQQIERAKVMIEEKVNEDDAYRAKVTIASANRETHRGSEGRAAVQGVTGGGDATSGIVSADVVVTERWDDPADSLTPRTTFTNVYVSAVVDPGCFWVQIINSQCVQFDELVNRMTIQYAALPPRDLNLSEAPAVTVGDMVAASFEFDDAWYRARVNDVTEDGMVNLLYVDYGDSGVVSGSHIHPLDDVYKVLPSQAILCHLANVEPVGDDWTDEACTDFDMLTHCAKWVVVMAQTVYYHTTSVDPIPCLILIDTSGDQDVDVNEEMVARGHAVIGTSHSNSTLGNILAAKKLSPSEVVPPGDERVVPDSVVPDSVVPDSDCDVIKIPVVTENCDVEATDEHTNNGVTMSSDYTPQNGCVIETCVDSENELSIS